jgi:hypothetical protein
VTSPKSDLTLLRVKLLYAILILLDTLKFDGLDRSHIVDRDNECDV